METLPKIFYRNWGESQMGPTIECGIRMWKYWKYLGGYWQLWKVSVKKAILFKTPALLCSRKPLDNATLCPRQGFTMDLSTSNSLTNAHTIVPQIAHSKIQGHWAAIFIATTMYCWYILFRHFYYEMGVYNFRFSSFWRNFEISEFHQTCLTKLWIRSKLSKVVLSYSLVNSNIKKPTNHA